MLHVLNEKQSRLSSRSVLEVEVRRNILSRMIKNVEVVLTRLMTLCLMSLKMNDVNRKCHYQSPRITNWLGKDLKGKEIFISSPRGHFFKIILEAS